MNNYHFSSVDGKKPSDKAVEYLIQKLLRAGDEVFVVFVQSEPGAFDSSKDLLAARVKVSDDMEKKYLKIFEPVRNVTVRFDTYTGDARVKRETFVGEVLLEGLHLFKGKVVCC